MDHCGGIELATVPTVILHESEKNIRDAGEHDARLAPAASSKGLQASKANANEVSLAPVDRGIGAWSFLAGAFIVEMVVWGFPNAYGVFLVKYLNDPELMAQKHASSLLPLIGPLTSGIIYCASPVTYPIASRYPRSRRYSLWAGALLTVCSLLGASYAKKVQILVILQGIMYAIGGCLLYAPCIYYMSEWFVEKRGLANGVINAGTAVGGLLLPLVLPTLLEKYGSAKTLRALSAAQAVLLCLSLPLVKGRLPEAKDTRLLFVLCANTLQGLAYSVPVLWLPTYASSLHLSPTASSLSLAFLNGASVVGRLSLGMLSDRFSPWLLGSVTLVLTSLATFVLWGLFSYSLGGVLAYGIAYGCLAGGWTSLWTSFVRPIARDDPSLSTSIFGILMLSRGVGNILSTPVSTSLKELRHLSRVSHWMALRGGYTVADGQYGNMIIYVGSLFAGAFLIVALGWLSEGRRSRRLSE